MVSSSSVIGLWKIVRTGACPSEVRRRTGGQIGLVNQGVLPSWRGLHLCKRIVELEDQYGLVHREKNGGMEASVTRVTNS